MPQAYFVPANSIEYCLEVKKSRFITRVFPIQDKDSIKLELEKARQDYPDARHYCWAYVLGPCQQPITMASNDDGEPSGTAGKPMLNVLSHKEMGDVGAIVIRYFGGIKLGAGGLVRAYSQAVQEATEKLELTEKRPHCRLKIQVDFAHESTLRHWLRDSALVSADYQQQLILTADVDVELAQELEQKLAQLDGSKLEDLS